MNEENLCIRIITDISVFASGLTVTERAPGFGFLAPQNEPRTLSFEFLMTLFQMQPGLMTDKLKAVLELVWKAAEARGTRGIVFAYDEAQVVADQKDKEQFPLAILLEVFQSLQRRGAKFLLLLTGLPTLFSRLVESRTYAERMFAVQEIGRLSPEASREAISVPLEACFWKFSERSIQTITDAADG